MADKARSVRGTQDIFGEEAARFDHVVETFHQVRKLYGFKSVHTPVFEFTEVFARSIGETTDVVSKEMYSFEDRGGESLTLRPEFTAGIARAYISNGWQQHAPLKLATHGPLFRYERPQKGRYRQFHQLDAEVLGAAEPAADVEVIKMAAHLLDELGLSDKVELQVNTLGDAATRSAWTSANLAIFAASSHLLSPESQQRLSKNPLRILDSKDERDWPIVAQSRPTTDFLTEDAQRHFDWVKGGLKASGLAFTINPKLVRGLDYYRHTAFEFVTTHLGAQGTVIGGGRYDGLVEALGGPPTPAVGWAAGIERLAMLLDARETDRVEVAVAVTTGGMANLHALEILATLRDAGVAAEQSWSGNLKKRMSKAAAIGARVAIIVGEDEYRDHQAIVRNLQSGEQRLVPLESIVTAVRRI